MTKEIRFSTNTFTRQSSSAAPALAEFKDGLICAFKSNDASNRLLVMASDDGENWSPTAGVSGNTTSAAPAIAEFNGKLYCMFRADDDEHSLIVSSSDDGSNWTPGNRIWAQSTSDALSLAVFNGTLYCAFRANNAGNMILLISSEDGENWSANYGIDGGQTCQANPSLAVFNDKLYCAFRSNDDSNRILLSESENGRDFHNTRSVGGQSCWGAPALQAQFGRLFCAFESADSSQRLLMVSSEDAQDWSPENELNGNTTSAAPALAAFGTTFLSVLFRTEDGAHEIFGLNGSESDWMQQSLDMFGERTLSQICITGSHDSGMSSFHNPTVGAEPCNTRTQIQTVWGQLVDGARYFDIRPTISSGEYYTGHYSDTGSALGWQGANGQKIDTIVTDINRYLEHHNELVILNISHDLQTDADYRRLNQSEWNRLLSKLNGIDPKYLLHEPHNTDLTSLRIRDLIRDGGRVMVIARPEAADISLGAYENNGFFIGDRFNIYDDYAGTNDLGDMVTDQVGKMQDHAAAGYFLLSWTLTQSSDQAVHCALECKLGTIWDIVDLFADLDATPILKLAEQANAVLRHNATLMDAVSATCFPNIVYIDAVAPPAGLVETALDINKVICGASAMHATPRADAA